MELLKRHPAAAYAGNAGKMCYLEFAHEDNEYTATCTTTGRVFAVVQFPKLRSSSSWQLGVLTEHQAIVEQRRGGGVTRLAGCADDALGGSRGPAPPQRDDDDDDPVMQPLRRGAQVQQLPRVPRLACAGCGAPQRDDGAAPMQRCAACAQVAYCCLHGQHHTVDELAVIDAALVRAVASTKPHGRVVHKTLVATVDEVAHANLLGMLVDDLAARVVREQPFETSCAIPAILQAATSRVQPCDAVGATQPSAVGFALV